MQMWDQLINHHTALTRGLRGIFSNRSLAIEDVGAERKVA
jgi:hypothetical protein